MNQNNLSFGGGGRRGFTAKADLSNFYSSWLTPIEAVPIDIAGLLPAPALRSWFYAWQTKKRFLAYSPPAVAQNCASWELATPIRWSGSALLIEPFFTYKFGNQGGMNPDQPAYVAGNFAWKCELVVLRGSQVPTILENCVPVSSVTWSIASVNNSDLVYKGDQKSLLPDDPQASGYTPNDKLWVQFYRTDLINRIVDLAGIRLTWSISP